MDGTLVQIKYSKHIESRLSLRRMDYNLPKRIFEQSKETYIDEETGYFPATMSLALYNKSREVMIAYAMEQDFVKLLTIHPLKRDKKRREQKAVDGGRFNERLQDLL